MHTNTLRNDSFIPQVADAGPRNWLIHNRTAPPTCQAPST